MIFTHHMLGDPAGDPMSPRLYLGRAVPPIVPILLSTTSCCYLSDLYSFSLSAAVIPCVKPGRETGQQTHCIPPQPRSHHIRRPSFGDSSTSLTSIASSSHWTPWYAPSRVWWIAWEWFAHPWLSDSIWGCVPGSASSGTVCRLVTHQSPAEQIGWAW